MQFGKLASACLRTFCFLLLIMPQPQSQVLAKDGFKPFVYKTLNGERKALQDFLNKATLVTFFFPTCSYCNGEMPYLQKVYDKYRDKGFSMVAIDIYSDQDSTVADWQATHHYTFPVLIGARLGSLQKNYDIKATPTHYLLDAQGAVILKQTGYRTGDEKILEQEIEKVLRRGP
ncbi:MAG TPA: TlpA disulfide reductase family protein [Acidobacteriota bacterium]|nr:TlpA disulfide reductase family protein [Acidobacteriota bacterium]